jgi:hypothetical protein
VVLYFKKTLTKHKRLASDTERVITENFEYDSQNRLLVHKHQVDNNPVEYLTQNKYNELSQLESKKVGVLQRLHHFSRLITDTISEAG